MFTGIIEAMASVHSASDGRLSVERPELFSDIQIGSSISVSGVCLSVTEFDSEQMQFDVIPETLSKTTLGALKTGDTVNLERALKADARFEGHIVQGHIEASVKVSTCDSTQGLLSIIIPKELRFFVVSKGSIAINGVSLTVVSIKDDCCSVALIPHTLEHTTLGMLKEGDYINIETDVLGKYMLSQKQL